VDQAILNGQSLVQQQGGFGADTPLQAVNGALSITFPKTASRSIVAAASYANALGLTVPAAANFHFPSEPDGGPPTVNLLATVYHDHGPQLVTDNIDIFPYTRQFLRQTGPDLSGEPLPKEAIQAAWGDKTQYNLWSVVNDHRAWSYTTDAQGRINGIGNTPFAYVHPEGRLLPGATRLRIDATWNPPIDIPGLAAKVSPANTPDWFEAATVVSKAPGSESWAINVDPTWWDLAPLPNPKGGWDVNIYRPLLPNTIYNGAITISYSVTVER
jgi:hypothetical protein